jgi:hypothetical protein
VVVGLGVGQRRGQTDGSEGQMGGKGWVPCLFVLCVFNQNRRP